MFFTTIEDEATLSGLRIQNIFTGVANNIKSIFDKTARISFNGGFEAQFQSDVIAIQNYINQLNAGRSAEEAFAATMRSASIEAQNFANSLNATTYSEEQAAQALSDFTARQNASQISMMAQNRSLSNVRLLMNEYNSGMQTCGLTTQQFRQSVGESNSVLGNYLGTVGVGNATMRGYIGSLVSAKVATIGLRIATTALNAVIGMGIGLIVSLISSGVQWVIEQIAEACKSSTEKLKDLNDEFDELIKNVQTLSNDFQTLKSNFNDVVPRFVELAKGVNEFGGNVKLTDEEYAEFLSLNNKIAEMFPDLNMGMDSNGNSMLALSYSADTLTSSLNDLLEAERKVANQKIADTMPDILENIQKTSKIKKSDDETSNIRLGHYNEAKRIIAEFESQTSDYQEEWGDQWKARLREAEGEQVARIMEDIFVGSNPNDPGIYDAWNNIVQKYIDDDGYTDWNALINSDEFTAAVGKIKRNMDSAGDEISAQWKKINSVVTAWMQTDDAFLGLDSNMQNVATNIVKQIDFEKLGKTTETEIQNYISENIITPLAEASPEVQSAFNTLLSMKPENYANATEYMNAIKSNLLEISNLSDSFNYYDLMKNMGYDEILAKYQNAIDGIKSELPEVTDAMINSLSPDELIEAFENLKSNGINSWDELQSFISSKRLVDSFNIDDIENLKDELDALKDTWDDISDIIGDYNKNGYYTISNLKSLLELEPEYLNALIDENGQINLNSQAYRDYISTKAKTLVIDQVKSLYETVLNMGLEEAQAYANAEAFETEAKSLGDLISATTQYYLVLAKAKDSQNNTTAYTDALKQSFGTVANYAAVYDSWLNSLSSSSNEFSTATDEATSALESQKEALESQKDALEDEKDALENAKDALEDYKDALNNAKDDINDLIDLTTDYIKQLKNDEKDALEEQKSQFDDLIIKRKEALELAKEEREEADKLADKQNAVVKDKLALAIAQLDDSSAGKKTQKKAAENLKSSNKDLTDYLYEQEYNARVAALEAEQEAFDNSIDEQKDKIDEYLSNVRQLYEDACSMIDNDTGELYGNLWDYTYKYTTQTRAEFDNLWSNAQSAIQRYRGDNESLLSVMENIQLKIYDTDVQIGNLNTQIDNCETQISELDTAISNTSDAINDTSSAIDNVSSSLDGLSSSISDYINQLNQLANTSVGDNANKTSFWVNYNGKKYETGYNYNGDTKGNRLLAASELTKLIAKDVSGFENYGLSQVQALLGVGGNETGHKWTYKFDGKTYESRAATKTLAVADIRSQLAKKYGNSSFVLDQVYGKITGYAEGTKSATGGLHIVDEEGLFSEFIPYQVSKGRYSFLPEGNPVFSKAMTNTMFDFASDPSGFVNGVVNNSSRNVGDINVNMPINIQGNATQETVKALEKKAKEIEETTIKKVLHYANLNKKPIW